MYSRRGCEWKEQVNEVKADKWTVLTIFKDIEGKMLNQADLFKYLGAVITHEGSLAETAE